MRKYILISTFILISFITFSQTTKTVGTSGDYSTLKLAFDDINAGTLTGNITLHIISDITDNNSAVLNASGTGSSSYTSVLIQPTGSPIHGYWILTASIDDAMIDLNGAKNVTIDGQLDGTGGEQNLYLVNNAATFHGSAILFRENAIYNTVEYCHIESNNASSSGVIEFGLASSSTQGNSHNLIDHCDITNTPTGVMNFAISSANNWNTNNVVKNCNIYNWRVEGIKLNPNCGRGWIIGGNGEGNSFYQTTSFSAPDVHYAIKATEADSLAIIGNNIGGGSPFTGYPAWLNTNTTHASYGIYVTGNASQTCYIHGNRILRINVAGTGFTAIEAYGLNAYIGTDAGNSIGGGEPSSEINMTGTGSITAIHAWATAGAPDFHISSNMIAQLNIINTSNSQPLYGISVFSSLTGNHVEIANNNIQQLHSNGNSSGLTVRAIGILANYATLSLTGNLIGRLVSSNGGSIDSKVEGISLSADYSTITLSKNQISELSNNCTGSSGIQEIDGIVINYQNGDITASNNAISIINEGNNNTMNIYGFRDRGSDGSPTGNHKYYFNSVYIGGSTSGSGITACFRRDIDMPVTLINNVFYNKRYSGVLQNYAVVVNSNNVTYLVSHHNDLFTKFPAVVCSVNGGTTPLTFASWQSAFTPAMEASSSTVNPHFNTITDLHIMMNENLDNTADPLTGISDDIDGTPRNILTPDPGINEFTYDSYTVGTGGHFVSLKHAFDRINDGTIKGNIHLVIISQIITDSIAELHASGTGSPASDYDFICIRPGGTLVSPSSWRLLSSFLSGPMIILDGAGSVTFDGRIQGETSGNNLVLESMDLSNERGEVILFRNGANSNTIQNCTIKANNDGGTGAIHFGSTGSSLTGNSYNTIDNCEITRSTTQLNNAVYCDSSEHNNMSNIIQNCNIYDWKLHGVLLSRPTFPGAGWVDYGNDTWLISGNSFYKTGSSIPAGGTAIELQKGNAHSVMNNYIGGTLPLAAGMYSHISRGIVVFGTYYASVSQPVYIEGNTIRSIKSSMFRGIYVDAQNVDIGSYGGNVIGDSLETFSIFGTGDNTYGIYILNHIDHVINIRNNMIANVVDSAFSSGDVLAGIGTIRIGDASYLGCNGEIFNNRIFNLTDYSQPYIVHSSDNIPAQPNVFGIEVKGKNLTVRDNKIYNLEIHLSYFPGIVDTIAGIWVRASGNNTFYNNAISLGSYSSGSAHDAIYGFLDASPEGLNNYYFNSVYFASGGSGNITPTFCFLLKGHATVNVLNNMFVNRQTGTYAINYPIGTCSSYNITSNHNNLYSDDPGLTGSVHCGNDPLDLKGWQTAFYPCQDVNSTSILPDFVSATDLHCTGPDEMDDRGICVPGLTDDIDGNIRMNPPDIGINEFMAKTYKTWIGDTPYWDVALNWSPLGVPTAANHVRLAPGINYSPTIRYDGATCNDLLIEPGVTLYVVPGKMLDVKGRTILVKYCP